MCDFTEHELLPPSDAWRILDTEFGAVTVHVINEQRATLVPRSPVWTVNRIPVKTGQIEVHGDRAWPEHWSWRRQDKTYPDDGLTSSQHDRIGQAAEQVMASYRKTEHYQVALRAAKVNDAIAKRNELARTRNDKVRDVERLITEIEAADAKLYDLDLEVISVRRANGL